LGASPLAESVAGDEVIMSIVGHASRAMLSRYSHVGMEANGAPSTRSSRACGADEKRHKEAEQQKQAAVASASALVQ
jgi:hypothetical protein